MTVLARTPEKLADVANKENLKIVQGDVLKEEDVSKVVDCQDAVICSLGTRPWEKGPQTQGILIYRVVKVDI